MLQKIIQILQADWILFILCPILIIPGIILFPIGIGIGTRIGIALIGVSIIFILMGLFIIIYFIRMILQVKSNEKPKP